MRISNLLSSAIILWCLAFFSSCSVSGVSPEIRIVDPLQCYATLDGHHINIDLEISDDEGLAEYWIDLESNSGQKYFSDRRQIDALYHKIEYKVDIQSDEQESYFLKVKVVDIEGSKTKKKYPIQVD